MLVQDLKLYEPVVYEIIENVLANNRLSHFYLLSGPINNLKLATAYLLALYIVNDMKYDEELYQRIKSHNYFDISFIDGNEKSIKVEDIERIQQTFQLTGVESKKKVAIINNINNSNTAVLNKLLKDIEEPNENNYYIMTTDNLDSLLETIKSRATILYFHKPSNSQLYDEFINLKYSELDSYLLSKFLDNSNVDDKVYNQAKDCVFETIGYFKDIDYLEIYYQLEIYPNIQKDKFKTFLKYYLNILNIYINDALANEFKDEEYIERLNIIKEYNIAAILEAVLEILRKSSYNYDRKLLMDELAYRLNRAIKGD